MPRRVLSPGASRPPVAPAQAPNAPSAARSPGASPPHAAPLGGPSATRRATAPRFASCDEAATLGSPSGRGRAAYARLVASTKTTPRPIAGRPGAASSTWPPTRRRHQWRAGGCGRCRSRTPARGPPRARRLADARRRQHPHRPGAAAGSRPSPSPPSASATRSRSCAGVGGAVARSLPPASGSSPARRPRVGALAVVRASGWSVPPPRSLRPTSTPVCGPAVARRARSPGSSSCSPSAGSSRTPRRSGRPSDRTRRAASSSGRARRAPSPRPAGGLGVLLVRPRASAGRQLVLPMPHGSRPAAARRRRPGDRRHLVPSTPRTPTSTGSTRPSTCRSIDPDDLDAAHPRDGRPRGRR